jgi:cation diffusion facilitator family transporter
MTADASTATPPTPHPDAAAQRRRMRAIGLSLAVSLILLGLKVLTYNLTHSAAVLSDALESIVNVVGSGFALLSIHTAAKPPDPDHPYGHGKIEYFSAGFEGALIIGAAAAIFYSGVHHLLDPRPLPNLEAGLLILAGATAINLLLGLYLVRVGRSTESAALTADGRHILTDVYSSGAVIAGLLLVHLTGWLHLDGAVACLIGLNILRTGGQLVAQSAKRLMDASDPELLDRITRLLVQNKRPDWLDIHQLRAWRAGTMIHVDLHLVLPEDLLLSKAHHEAKLIEDLIRQEFNGNAGVLVHMDPCRPGDCPICARQNCHGRHSNQEATLLWSHRRLVRQTPDLPPDEKP